MPLELVAPRRARDVSNGAPARMIRILIVDETPTIRTLFHRMFTASGVFEVVGDAASAADGVRLAADLQPDVVLLDLPVPGASGYDAIPAVAARCPSAMIVVLSGVSGDAAAAHARSLGAHAFIEKRHRPDELLRQIIGAYRSRVPQSTAAAPSTLPPPSPVPGRRFTDGPVPWDVPQPVLGDFSRRSDGVSDRERGWPREEEPTRAAPSALRIVRPLDPSVEAPPATGDRSRVVAPAPSTRTPAAHGGLPRRVAVGPVAPRPATASGTRREREHARPTPEVTGAGAAPPAPRDVRSALQVVVGFSELLASAYADRVDPEGQEMIDAIVSNAHRLEEMIGELVTADARAGVARHGEGPSEPEPEADGDTGDQRDADPARPIEVLLVEDDPDHAKLIRALLRRVAEPAHRLHTATSIEEAHEVLAMGDIDCVLLDLTLPDADELEALTEVRAAAPLSAIVVVTEMADEELAFNAVSHGAQDFLVKGHIDPEQLGRAIRWSVQRKVLENELTRDALHDPLTHLPNRTLMMDRLSSALARSERSGRKVVVFFMDLDGFKLINDRFGHDAGDQFLVVMSERLRTAVRPQDTVSRIGGDEFVIVCEGFVGYETEWMPLQERLVEAVSIPMEIDGHLVHTSASIGVSVGGRESDPESMLRDADMAMYAMKRSR